MTLYFMAFGYGLLWRVWEWDGERGQKVYASLRFYWGEGRFSKPRREWCLSKSDCGGICYTEKSKLRTGSWVLRGPWEKVA
jgi:hypothetical protein